MSAILLHFRAPAVTLPRGGFRGQRDTYRTKDGRAYFEFEFVRNGNHYEIDIRQQPRYGNRPSDAHSTHRLPSNRGGQRICFGDPSVVGDLASAYTWAAAWAEHTWTYIQTGTPFPNDDVGGQLPSWLTNPWIITVSMGLFILLLIFLFS